MNEVTSREAALLGMDMRIDRRDFIVGALAGTCSIAGCAVGEPNHSRWNGYGGEGDYAASNGNTESVRDAAHGLRDGLHHPLTNVVDTSEVYDVVVVGGGLAGLAAAVRCQAEGGKSCLILENHAIFGGEAKENEFFVDGYRLVAPQGSNDFAVPVPGSGEHATLWRDLGIPEHFDFEDATNVRSEMLIGRENFVPMYWSLDAATVGHFFRQGNVLLRDFWDGGFHRAPLSATAKGDLQRWRLDRPQYGPSEQRDRWLDSMTYGDLLSRMKLGPEVNNYVDPILAVGAYGVSSDAVSAYAAAQLRLPGAYEFEGRNPLPKAHETYISFPGGNSGIARYLVKRLIPDALDKPHTFGSIINGRINFKSLDVSGSPTRIRLDSTVIAVRHSNARGASGAEVVYVKNGRRYRLFARSVVMATGGWMTKHVVRDLPDQHQAALDEFVFAPVLVVNVALRHWRFLDRLGISAARWFEGFGFFANIRRPMRVGPNAPAFDPDKPTILTMYVGFPSRGKSAREQSSAGRLELLNNDFASYELKIRRQLSELFARAGFDARRDIAGIVLNRWGHAFVAPQPGFYFDGDSRPAPSRLAREAFGNISFGHSQFEGHQNWIGAVSQGARAAAEAISSI